MTPLAIIAKQAGFKVTGCDISEEFITDQALAKEEIVPLIGFSISHIDKADLIITTGAHGGFDHVEIVLNYQYRVAFFHQPIQYPE